VRASGLSGCRVAESAGAEHRIGRLEIGVNPPARGRLETYGLRMARLSPGCPASISGEVEGLDLTRKQPATVTLGNGEFMSVSTQASRDYPRGSMRPRSPSLRR